MKKILITGANFSNKGAQSMLFTTVDAILKRNPSCEIYFTSEEVCDTSEYTFQHIFCPYRSRQIALHRHTFFYKTQAAAVDLAKFLLRRRDNLGRTNDLCRLMPEVDFVIDISGYGVGDKWPVEKHERFLDGIRLAEKYQIPMVIMPQSFGPFNYDPAREFLLQEMKELLPYPERIYVRGENGYQFLQECFGLNNVVLSSDLVLQSSGIETKNIFKNPKPVSVPEVLPDSVGIVPNMKCFEFGDKEKILSIYRIVIDELLASGKNIVVLRHSKEDLEAGRWIYELYADNQNVSFLKNDFSCLEYDEMVKQFQFLVSSRFHGTVHAYRNAVPCLILGWAEKYQELAALAKQEQYVFNMVDDAVEINSVKSAVHGMIQNYAQESSVIRDRVADIQRDNCFNCLNTYIGNDKG